MPRTRSTPPTRSPNLQAALVARSFYLEGRQKSEIAEQFGLSRFKVARLLDEARESGIVHISVEMPPQMNVALGERVASRWGLRHVLVANDAGQTSETSRAMMATLAADFLTGTVGPNDVLGISWGSSVAQVIDEIHRLPGLDVVQLVGGVRSSELDTNGSELVRRLSHISGGRAFPLMAPLVVETTETADALRGERVIAETLNQFSRLTTALVGIGSWKPERSSLIREVSASDRKELLGRGAVADVCGVVLDADGQLITSSMNARTLSIGSDQLKAVPNVIAVAGGSDKVSAIRAALASGLVDVLVSDGETAEALSPEGK